MVADSVDAAQLVCRIEAHAVAAWPATITERTADGWTLRATPGLDRGRSNHALSPCRPVRCTTVDRALARAAAFASRHGIALGVQVSPLHCHATLESELDARGWAPQGAVVVMARDPVGGAPASLERPSLTVADAADLTWLRAWERCEQRGDVAIHADTVLAGLCGRAWFARLGQDAVAIAVPGDGLLGLFSIAVAPARRRQGLGRAIVGALLARARQMTAYLQVFERNHPAIALYEQLGFREAYRYRHRLAP